MAKEEGTDTDKDTDKEAEKTAEQLAAEKAEAAEARAAELEAENTKLKADKANAATTTRHPASGYSISSFSDQEWVDAEAQTGLDRKAILFNLNQQLRIENQMDKKMQDSVGTLHARVSLREEREALGADDPLYPKYRKEVDKFLNDIPTEMLKTEEGRKKWLGKAFDYAKKTVKIPNTKREADTMDTRESGKGKDKSADTMSVEEKEVLSSHGKTEEDYKKIAHPVFKDGIMIKDRPEAPKFGPRQ